MERLARIETIREAFFATDSPTAPKEALDLEGKWRREWLLPHSVSRNSRGVLVVDPRVSMGPGVRDNQSGFLVRQEIMILDCNSEFE